MLRWDDPVAFVTGATPSVRRAWESLGIKTVGDLLMTLPRRYDDYSKVVAIRDARAGDVVTVRGQVVKCAKLPTFRKRFQIIRVTIKDASGTIAANFFNQVWLLEELKPDRAIVLSGKVVMHPRYGKSLANPLWEPGDAPSVAAGKLAPVYPLTGSLAQKTYRRLLLAALHQVEFPADSLDVDGVGATLAVALGSVGGQAQGLPLRKFADAIRSVHEPKDLEDAERGRERLAFDELLTYQLALRLARTEADHAGAPTIALSELFAKKFASSLPFVLTADQKRAVWAAMQDMVGSSPMRRLLSGDVGSGKTAVAAFLSAHVQRAGASAAILAPTDILARQHAETLRRLFAPHRVPLLLVTRTDKRWFFDREEREVDNAEMLDVIRRGNLVTVGTHALLEAGRLPPDLALAIVDEQHRFGVAQREALAVAARPDGRVPHFLSMTATPIPRSLALTFYGDLTVSSLHEKPAGRLPIKTTVEIGAGRERAYAAIRQAVARGERAFVVCALIDPSDALGVRSATEEFQRLKKGPLAGLRLGLLHGRLKPKEKDETMQAFATGELDVLVATAVIEVGVDVPEATVIAIEGAERFGLAQLHQFRGRVGRSHRPSFCFLMTDNDGPSLDRLKLLERIQDGLVLAEEDLKRRGSGNLFGTAQSGDTFFQAARPDDLRLMVAAREEAERLLAADPSLQKFPAWLARVELLRQTAHLE